MRRVGAAVTSAMIASALLLAAGRARGAEVMIGAGQEYTLTEDIVLNGTESFTAGSPGGARCKIHGAGFQIRAAADRSWLGTVVIHDCDIDTLGTSGTRALDLAGGVDITVEGTTFSTSGAIFLRMGTDTAVTFRRNLIAEDSVVRIVNTSLDMSEDSFAVEGGSTGTKVFQGNVVRKSRIRFDLTGDWLIGGNTAADANILVGPRTGIEIGRCGPMTIRGNYSHTFGAGWNQVKNLSVFSPEGGELIAEHNVFIGSDWNTEFDSPGELRYNLFMQPHQHAWIHVYSGTGTRAHHNLLVQTSENTYNTVQGGFNVFEPYDPTLPTRPTEIYNNTLDGGSECNPGNAGGVLMAAPLASLRSNAFVGLRLARTAGNAVIGNGAKETPDPLPPLMGYADYNLFYNPDATVGANYNAGVGGKNLRADPGFGYHDLPVGGAVNEQVAPKFANKPPRLFPFADMKLDDHELTDVDRALIDRTLSVCQILAYYRRAYTPAPDSPLVDAGDPQEGPGNDIGAIGAGMDNALDLFGKLCDPEDIGPAVTAEAAFTCKAVPVEGGMVRPDDTIPMNHGFVCVCRAGAGAPGGSELAVAALLLAFTFIRRPKPRR